MALQSFTQEHTSAPFGLINESRIHCYWNSTLQLLISCTSFTQKILELSALPGIDRDSFICAFAEFTNGKLTNMQLYKKYIVALYATGKSSQLLQDLMSYQQCVSETLTYILEIFEQCEPIVRLFQHRYLQSLICSGCKHLSEVKINNTIIELNPTQVLPDSICKLVETIEGYKCKKCESVDDKPRINTLVMAPEIISVVLKKYVWESGSGKKTEENTILPEYIQINILQYRAVAYIDHYGQTIDSGHYVTTALRKEADGKLAWYEFNDNLVSQVEYAPGTYTYMVIYNYVCGARHI